MTDSTAVAVRNGNEGAINAFHSESSFESAQRMARALASSNLVPQSYRGNLADCLIAIELANRTGASVPMVMQNLDIIHGRPSWRSTFLIATVNACGRFSPLRFRFQGSEGSDDWGCRAVARDRSDGEECVGPLVTIGIAKAEGWFSKNGSKWKTLPELMLTYRAAAFWTRTYAPELSLGMLTSEEAEFIPPPPNARIASVAEALHSEDLAEVIVDAEPTNAAHEIKTWKEPEEKPIEEEPEPEDEPAEEEKAEPEPPHAARLKKLNSKYFAMLAERQMDNDADRRAFQKRLHTNALIASESCATWTPQDYLSAIAELDEIPPVSEAPVNDDDLFQG